MSLRWRLASPFRSLPVRLLVGLLIGCDGQGNAPLTTDADRVVPPSQEAPADSAPTGRKGDIQSPKDGLLPDDA